jgi:hypothetical protein
MPKKISIAPIVIVIGIAVVLQLALIGIDCQQSPVEVAKTFASEYYYLDGNMQNHLCADLAKDGELVDSYLYSKEKEASELGFSTNYLRRKFTKLHARVVESDKDKMTVHLTGTTRVCINPAFMVVGELFGIGKDYAVDTTLELVKEGNQWRVCGTPFGMTPGA